MWSSARKSGRRKSGGGESGGRVKSGVIGACQIQVQLRNIQMHLLIEIRFYEGTVKFSSGTWNIKYDTTTTVQGEGGARLAKIFWRELSPPQLT